MRNEGELTGQLLSRHALPWRLGQGCTDDLITHAERRGAVFSVNMGSALHRVTIGQRWAGWLNSDLTLVKWPAIDEAMLSDEEYIAWQHDQIDQSPGPAKCYFIGGDVGAIKIGYSIDPEKRLKAIQGSSPIPVQILALRNGGEAREAVYHQQFAAHRLHGEWFTRCPEIEAEIAHLNTPTPSPTVEARNG